MTGSNDKTIKVWRVQHSGPSAPEREWVGVVQMCLCMLVHVRVGMCSKGVWSTKPELLASTVTVCPLVPTEDSMVCQAPAIVAASAISVSL